MSSLAEVESILDELGIPYIRDDWSPRKPPQNTPYYATVSIYENDDGADEVVLFRRIAVSINLYDAGTKECKEMRRKLHDALSEANYKHSMSPSFYFTQEKVHLTEYEINSFIQKEAFNETGY